MIGTRRWWAVARVQRADGSVGVALASRGPYRTWRQAARVAASRPPCLSDLSGSCWAVVWGVE